MSYLNSMPVSASVKPTPPKKSALDGSAVDNSAMVKSPLVMSATKFVQTMTEAEFVDLISCLMRVVWAAAAGKLYLAAVSINPCTGCFKKTHLKEMCDFLTLKRLPLGLALIKTKNRHLFDPLVKN